MAPTNALPNILNARTNVVYDANVPRSTNSYGNPSLSTGLTIFIIVFCVIIVLKIFLIIWLCHVRNKKREERRRRGCTCFNDSDYFCTPIWFWSRDTMCHCGAMNGARNVYAPGSNALPVYYAGAPAPEYAQSEGFQLQEPVKVPTYAHVPPA